MMNHKILETIRNNIGADAFVEPGKFGGDKKLESSVEAITSFMRGGLPYQAVSEFGLPLGREGRNVLMTFVNQATKNGMLTLWINCHQNLFIFPPAWFAKGVIPEKIVFANSQKPLEDLKRAIMQPLFKFIVFDTDIKTLSLQDCHFLSWNARTFHQVIVVIRKYFLSNRKGNSLVKLRVNAYRNFKNHQYAIHVIKGVPSLPLFISDKFVP